MADAAVRVISSRNLSAGQSPATPINNAPPRNGSLTHGKAPDHSRPNTTAEYEQKPAKESYKMSNGPTMSAGHQLDSQDAGPQAPLDPISRQILERTQSQHKASQPFLTGNSSYTVSGPSEDPSARQTTDPASLRRVDSNPSSKPAKEKKKGVSFLSRIMGGKKREGSIDLHDDNESILSDTRPAGNDAEVFSQPLGFVPRFPPPPKYIKVKAQNRRQRSFDRVFLAQVLLGSYTSKSRTPSDAKIVDFDDAPQPAELPKGAPASKAIWAMEFSKDGKYLAAAGQDKKLRVWAVIASTEDREVEERNYDAASEGCDDVRLNAPVFKTKLIREYDGHTSSILDLSWSKNNFILSSSMDKTVRLYHVSRTECLCAFKHNDFVTSIQFHPRDDRFFLAGSLDSKLRLWSIPDKSVAFWAQVPDMVTAVAFTPDGKTALAGCLNGLCILYDTEGLKAHSQIHVRSARGRNAKGSKITGIDTIALPRGNGQVDVKVLITSNDSRVRMYNLKDRTLEIKFRGNENACSQIHATFSEDGKYVICGSEDRKVYIWPTGPIEKGDPEKRPLEVFEAHSAIVTTALLAPTNTKQLLAQSGDPVYDLCNPPPVTLLSRSDSVISSRAPTEVTGHSGKDQESPHAHPKSDSPRRAPETPAYVARCAHPGGNLIVTADYTGSIKIFRQDCAYQKRRQESWDNNSTFSKKILGRSGSITNRTSITSSVQNAPGSLNSAAKNPSSDRINNWRNSVSHTNGNGTSNRTSVSDLNLKEHRSGSSSPKKSLSHRFSLRHSSHSAANETDKSPPHSPTHSPSESPAQPRINLQSASPSISPGAEQRHSDERSSSHPAPTDYHPLPRDPNDPLWMQGSQSYMYWNVKDNLAPMANHQPRTPGLLPPDGRDPLSRRGSAVSQLSSELISSRSESETEEAEEVDGAGGSGAKKENQNHQDSDLTCSRCGNNTFRATIDGSGVTPQRLKCKRCGQLV